jgi:hypothetical protein
VYADFLDLPQGSAHVHELNYSVPRICHLSSSDFDFVMEIDRNNRARPHCYGIRPVSSNLINIQISISLLLFNVSNSLLLLF